MALKASAFALFGVACVVAVSLVFLAIGKAEDAEREASQAAAPAEPARGRGRAALAPPPAAASD